MEFVFGNLGFILFILSLFIASVTFKASHYSFWEQSLRWVSLLPVGVGGIYGFIMHGLFGNIAAATIGWQNSPFQYEVAVANLGFGLLGLFSFKSTLGFRKASVLGTACWFWGDASGHIYQMITTHDFAPGNAGSWFWLDVLCPIVLVICIVKMSQARTS